jgi:hypothetical protein
VIPNSPSPVKRFRRRQAGQSLTEFAIVLAGMLSIVLTMLLLLAVFSEHGWRLLRLIGLEYP